MRLLIELKPNSIFDGLRQLGKRLLEGAGDSFDIASAQDMILRAIHIAGIGFADEESTLRDLLQRLRNR